MAPETVAPRFHFDPERHQYWLDGRWIPSVTTVLEPEEQLEGIPPEQLAIARIRGRHVHEAAALLARDNLRWDTLDPLLVGYAHAAKKFLRETNIEILRIEHQMFDAKLRVAGTLDLLGNINGRCWLIDYKSGHVSRCAPLQTAGYELLYRSNYAAGKLRRGVCQLRSDGTYRLIPCENPGDTSLFLSCLNLWHWRRRPIDL